MIQPSESKVIRLKYAALPFGKQTEEQRTLSAFQILLKINTITGWSIPTKEEYMDILVDQFQKKLDEKYRNMNEQEIEYAFRNRGLEIKDWGKALNLTMIDDVLLPYLEQRFDLSRTEEVIASKIMMQIEDKVKEEEKMTPEDWHNLICSTRKYPFDVIPTMVYDHLCEIGMITLTIVQKNDYMAKAIGHMHSTLVVDTQERMEFLKMKENGAFSKSVTSNLINIAKKFSVRDYLNSVPEL